MNNNQDKNELVLALQFQDVISQKLDHLYKFNKGLAFELLEMFNPEYDIQNRQIDVFPEFFELNKELLSLCYHEYHNSVEGIRKSITKNASGPLSEIVDSLIIHKESLNKAYDESITICDQLIKSSHNYLKTIEDTDSLKRDRLTRLSEHFTMDSERILLNKILTIDLINNNSEANSIELF